MRKMIVVWLCCSALSFFNCRVFAQVSNAPEIKILKGQVAKLHWVASTVVVRWLDGTRYDELTFTVEKTAKIYRNGKAVSLASLNPGDQVTVEYYDDAFEGLKATKITIVGGL